MKVKELITHLNDLVNINENIYEWEVVTEGCDCNGDVAAISLQETTKPEDSYILLERS